MYKSYNKFLLKKTIKNKHINTKKKITFKKWVKIKKINNFTYLMWRILKQIEPK